MKLPLPPLQADKREKIRHNSTAMTEHPLSSPLDPGFFLSQCSLSPLSALCSAVSFDTALLLLLRSFLSRLFSIATSYCCSFCLALAVSHNRLFLILSICSVVRWTDGLAPDGTGVAWCATHGCWASTDAMKGRGKQNSFFFLFLRNLVF